MNDFLQLGLGERVASALTSYGFVGPTPIQATSIPLILSGKDLYIESETGSGKTLAYLAPTLGSLGAERTRSRSFLVIVVPTQELAAQVARQAEKLVQAAGLEFGVALILGGSPVARQQAEMHRSPAVVVGTLGRIHDLCRAGIIDVKRMAFAVLDEADRMLAAETREELTGFLSMLQTSCQRIVVSATLPPRTRRALSLWMRDPASASGESVLSLPAGIEHWCFACDSRKRLEFVRSFEAAVQPSRCLVFMSQAGRAEEAAQKLAARGLPVEAIHAGMDKEERRVALDRFAHGRIRYLITSDLAARGLDIPSVSHILSLDLPEDPVIYVHRAGRTARAGAKGVSIVLADRIELERASRIAVKAGFVFRCKILSHAQVLEPPVAQFFDLAERLWNERQSSREDSGPVYEQRERKEFRNPRREAPQDTRREPTGRFAPKDRLAPDRNRDFQPTERTAWHSPASDTPRDAPSGAPRPASWRTPTPDTPPRSTSWKDRPSSRDSESRPAYRPASREDSTHGFEQRGKKEFREMRREAGPDTRSEQAGRGAPSGAPRPASWKDRPASQDSETRPRYRPSSDGLNSAPRSPTRSFGRPSPDTPRDAPSGAPRPASWKDRPASQDSETRPRYRPSSDGLNSAPRSPTRSFGRPSPDAPRGAPSGASRPASWKDRPASQDSETRPRYRPSSEGPDSAPLPRRAAWKDAQKPAWKDRGPSGDSRDPDSRGAPRGGKR